MMRRWLFPLIAGLVIAAVAYQATVYLFPQVLMRGAISRLSTRTGANQMTFVPLATDKSRVVVRPSPDLAYATCPIDLSKSPVRVTASVPGKVTPYWSLSVFNSRTDTAFVQNNTQSMEQPISILLATPAQAATLSKAALAGATLVKLDNPHAMALVRILVPNRAEFPAIDKARRASHCEAVGA